MMINAGNFNKKIKIYSVDGSTSYFDFDLNNLSLVLSTHAYIKTTKGITIIKADSDFEKAYTNFTIRYPKIEINREMVVEYNNKIYQIEYINNVNEKNIELELQCKVVEH